VRLLSRKSSDSGALSLVLGASAALAFYSLPLHAAVPEDHPDASATATLGIDAPKALPLMEGGDAALAARKFGEAAQLFDEAAKLSPKSGMLRRKHCEALAGAGRRKEALSACDRAYELGSRSAYDVRKMVGVRVTGAQAPTPLEAYQAYDLASLAIRSDSGLPWGYAALADIANRLGDPELLARTLWQLQQLAPTHPETLALASLVKERGSSGSALIGRLLCALLALGTLAHWAITRFAARPAVLPASRAPTS
jgi:tetratricopeptide (TPR) repeat protein